MRNRLAVIFVCLFLFTVAAASAGPFDSLVPPGQVPALIPVSTGGSSGGGGGGGGGGSSAGGSSGGNSGGTGSGTGGSAGAGGAAGGSSGGDTDTSNDQTNVIQNPFLQNDNTPDEDIDSITDVDFDESDSESEIPSPNGLGSATVLLLVLVPVLIGVGAWYVLSHRKKHLESEQSSTSFAPLGELHAEMPMQQEVNSSSLTSFTFGQQPVAPHIQFDPVTLRKARQYVAGLRAQNIPDHKISRAMREADWPAAYIDEAMKTE